MGALRERLAGNTRFRLVRKLGEGGMGTVYEAEDNERGERVAIKTLIGENPTNLLRFKNEFRSLTDLAHPNLVRLGELHEASGDWFFTMELVAGTDLMTHVQEGRSSRTSVPIDVADTLTPSPRPYDEVKLRACFQQLAVGLRALHAAGKVHRDIKPSNVRVTPEGRVVILDFGLVMDRAAARMSTEGNVVGTVSYMAPEQASGGEIDSSADWYAFGVVLYEALTGTLPFSGANLQVLLDKLRITPPPPRARVPQVPADLDELCVALLHFSPSERPRGDEVLRRLGVTSEQKSTPESYTASLPGESALFVGRNAEVAAIRRTLTELESGRTLTLSVEGPSGMGKSALVSRFVQQTLVGRPDVMVLSGRCYERETARFKALDGIVDALATALTRLPGTERHELVPRNAALLRQLFPVLGRVDVLSRAPRQPNAPMDPVEERRWMFTSLRELLAKLGERKLVVLVIDDMHWADGDSLELLRAILDDTHAPPPRLLLLVTSRVPWLNIGAGRQDWPVPLRTLQIGPLADSDALSLARTLIERHGIEGVAAEHIVRESGGHPLFVAELARHAQPDQTDKPLTLDEAIWERARGLPAPALRALMLLAVASVPLPIHLLPLATQLTPTEFERHLGLLRLSGFVRSATGRELRRVEPFHDRVREAVFDRLDDAQRVELHATLAPLLEQEPGVDPEHVASHYYDAGELDKAATLFERAARRAEEGFAFERAALLYRMELEARAPSPAVRSDIYRKIGAALARAGLARRAADAYAAAMAGADKVSAVQLRYLSAAHLLRSGHVTEGLAALELVLESVGLSAPKNRVGAVVSFLWERLRMLGQSYHVPFREAGLIAPHLLARADALASVAQGLAWVDGVRAAPLFARALRTALAARERSRITRALCGEALMLSLVGRKNWRRTAKALAAVHAAAEGIDDTQIRGTVLLTEAAVACNTCEFQRCLDKANEALAVLDNPAAEAQWERSSARIFRMYGHMHLGRFRALVEEADDAVADADTRRDQLLGSILRVSAGYSTLRVGLIDVDRARTLIDEGYAPWRLRDPGFMHVNWLLQSVTLDCFAGRGDLAVARFREHQAGLRSSGSLRSDLMRALIYYQAAVAHLLAVKQHCGVGSLDHALRLARGIEADHAHFHGLAALIRAQVALAREQPSHALELARSARAHFENSGGRHYAMATDWLMGSILDGEQGAALRKNAESYYVSEAVGIPEIYLRSHIPIAMDLG